MTQHLRKVISQNQPSKLTSLYAKIQRLQNVIRRKAATNIEFSAPLIEREGQGIIYPRTINVIQGKTGVHKSRLVEEFCAALLGREGHGSNIGFLPQGIERQKLTVLYVDTERNINDQFPYAIQQIKRKSGYGPLDHVPDFDFISLIGIKRDERLTALQVYLSELRENCDHHLFIVLDVITDCLSNFNDPSESMRLTDMMNTLINDHDVTFLCVIHENPNENSNKARGHLGTELCNKASCLMQIGLEKDGQLKNTQLIRVNYLKTRMGRKPEPIYLRYCDQIKGLVSAGRDLISEVSDSRRTKATMQEVFEGLQRVLKTPSSRQEVIAKMVKLLQCGSRTIIDRLKIITDSKVTFRDALGQPCTLSSFNEGRKLIYSLIPNKRQGH